MTTPTPTPDQIEDVQTYLTNLIAFYDTFHDYAQDKINICYSFESITEPSDPGNDWALSLLIKVALTLASSLSALAGLGEVSQAAQVAIKIGLSSATGIANSIYGNFKTTGGMDGSLNKEFAFIWDRFSTTLLQVREQLTSYYSNVAQNWNQTFTDPYTQRSFALNALTNATFPMSSESLFQQYLDSALAMFEYFLWQATISSQFVMNMGDSGNDWPYAQALPDAISSCNQNGRYYQFLAYIIWNSPTNPHTTANSLLRAQYAEYYLQRAEDNAGLANAAANYLFIDNGLGSLVNPQGIAYRGDVFHSWGVGKVESGFLFPFPAQMVGSLMKFVGTPSALVPGTMTWSVSTYPISGFIGAVTTSIPNPVLGSGFSLWSYFQDGSLTLFYGKPNADQTDWQFILDNLSSGAQCNIESVGLLQAAPAIAYSSDYYTHIVMVLNDGYVYTSYFDPNTQTWSALPTRVSVDIQPPPVGIVSLPTSYYRTQWNSGDIISGTPTLFTRANGGLSVFACICHISIDNSNISPGTYRLMEYYRDDPTAAFQSRQVAANGICSPSFSPDTTQLFVVDTNGTLSSTSFEPSTQQWAPLSALQFTPAVSPRLAAISPVYRWGVNQAWCIFGRGPTNTLIQLIQQAPGSSLWSWTDITAATGNQATCAGVPVADPQSAQVFARGASGQLYNFYIDPDAQTWQYVDVTAGAENGCLTTSDPLISYFPLPDGTKRLELYVGGVSQPV